MLGVGKFKNVCSTAACCENENDEEAKFALQQRADPGLNLAEIYNQIPDQLNSEEHSNVTSASRPARSEAATPISTRSEKRIDPYDGKVYTYDEFYRYWKSSSTVSEKELKAYWRTMAPQKPRQVQFREQTRQQSPGVWEPPSPYLFACPEVLERSLACPKMEGLCPKGSEDPLVGPQTIVMDAAAPRQKAQPVMLMSMAHYQGKSSLLPAEGSSEFHAKENRIGAPPTISPPRAYAINGDARFVRRGSEADPEADEFSQNTEAGPEFGSFALSEALSDFDKEYTERSYVRSPFDIPPGASQQIMINNIRTRSEKKKTSKLPSPPYASKLCSIEGQVYSL